MFTKKNKSQKNIFFMNLALMQAKKILGNTSTNPAVGAVYVKNNQILAAAHTSHKGRPHAEQNIFSSLKSKISGADLYLTLEPCSHYGKTSPCTNLIIRNKVKKVYFSILDPDKRSFNKSRNILNKYKVKTNVGLLNSQTKDFYKSYLRYKNEKLPYVNCKMAISKDYFTINKKNKWITNDYSRSRGHLIRSQHDCIITSCRTIINDNPNLNCRISGLENRSPGVIILDKNLNIPIKSNVIKNAKKNFTLIFFNKFNKKKIVLLKKKNVKIYYMPLHNNNFNLKNILIKIRKFGFSRVFIESGINLISNFLKYNLIDNFYLFISNKKIGLNGQHSFNKINNNFLLHKKCTNEKVNLFGDKLAIYKLK